VKWRLLFALIGGLAVALLAKVCVHGAASLEERRVVVPATSLLEVSARAIEAELNLRGRTLGELSEQVAGDPDLPAELEAASGRADHRIGQFRGVRPEIDAVTLMNAKGVVVSTNEPRYHAGDSLVARPEASAPGGAPPKHVAVGTPGLLDAVLDGYPSRGVSFFNGVLYHWGAAPVRVRNEVVGAVLIERRLQALPVAGCEAFLVVGGRVVLGRAEEGWRNFVAGGADKPFLMVAKDAGPSGTRPAGGAGERLGVWAARFHVPGSPTAVGFVTIDTSGAVTELASFQATIVHGAWLVWLVFVALLLMTAPLAPVDERWVRWLGGLRRRLGEARQPPPSAPSTPTPTPSRQSSTSTPSRQSSTVVLKQPPAAAPEPDGEDAKETPPLGVQISSPLPGIIDALPIPGLEKRSTEAVAANAFEGDDLDMDATSTIPMTPELMAELGLSDIPEDPALETQVMNLDDLLAAIKAGPTPEAAEQGAAPETTQQEAAPETTQQEAAPEPAQQGAAPETTQQGAAPETTQQETPPETPSAPPLEPEQPGLPEEVAEDPVYREVYTRFIGMRRLCGQPIDLAFEAFKEDLEKSQAQIIAQHGCKRVRFHVLVRSGKAILATTPLP
jgi:hypothetical protein